MSAANKGKDDTIYKHFHSDEHHGLCNIEVHLAPVVQTMDSTVHRINHYPADKHQQKKLSYPVDSDLSSGQRYPAFEQLEPGPGCSKPD